MQQYNSGATPQREQLTVPAWSNSLWEEFEEVDLDDHEPPIDREYGELGSGK